MCIVGSQKNKKAVIEHVPVLILKPEAQEIIANNEALSALYSA